MQTHQKALDKFGTHEQYFKLIEEMSELTQAIIDFLEKIISN